MTVLTQRRRDTERPSPRDFVMEINDVSGSIVDRAMKIHQALGPGLLESVYHRVLAYELRKAGFEVEPEVQIPVEWDGNIID